MLCLHRGSVLLVRDMSCPAESSIVKHTSHVNIQQLVRVMLNMLLQAHC